MNTEAQDSPNNITRKRVIYAIILFLVVIVLCAAGWFLQFASQAASGDKSETVAVIIPTGSSVKKINRILANVDLVQIDIRFPVLAKYLGIASKLQAGEFALHRGQTPQELLKELSMQSLFEKVLMLKRLHKFLQMVAGVIVKNLFVLQKTLYS